MKYFIFLLGLSARILAFNYYEQNQNSQTYNIYENLFGYNNQNSVKVLNYDDVGQGLCPDIKQPLCATNGQDYLYFENPCQFEIRNYEELIQGRQEYFECPLNLCQPKCSQCPKANEQVCAVELQTGQVETFQNPCEIDRKAYLTGKTYRIVARSECPEKSTQNIISPQYCSQEYEPICIKFDNELQEFPNNCELQKFLSGSNKKWQIFKMGKCLDDNGQDINNNPIASPQSKKCPELCTTEYRPICARLNDEFREFFNECQFGNEVCTSNKEWEYVSMGPCFTAPDNTDPEPPKCPEICTADYKPICAELNGELREFSNNCVFQRTKCQTKEDWRFVRMGPCYTEPDNVDPQLPKCPIFCTKEYKPVCAKLNYELREFSNNCVLQKTICETNEDWQIVRFGSCSSEPVTTDPQPPKCPDVCTEEYRPICAKLNNESREFSNNCDLQRTICQTNEDWRFVSMGPCYTAPDNVYPQPPKCPEACTLEYRPICAKLNDELREFSNNCQLQSTICQTKEDWQFVRNGPCFLDQEIIDPLPAKCPEVCTLEFRPICAKFNNELREFPNNCSLQSTICQTNNDWQVVREGPCYSDSENTSNNYEVAPAPNCPKFCTKEYNPVCASYNSEIREFSNSCELQRLRCETNIDWKFERMGPCFPEPDYNEPKKPECPKFCTKEFNPVCAVFGSERREFSNICVLENTICETNTDWTILNQGRCPQECDDEEYKPICAILDYSLKTFRNLCELSKENESTGKAWSVLYSGECQIPPPQTTSLSPYYTTAPSVPVYTEKTSIPPAEDTYSSLTAPPIPVITAPEIITSSEDTSSEDTNYSLNYVESKKYSENYDANSETYTKQSKASYNGEPYNNESEYNGENYENSGEYNVNSGENNGNEGGNLYANGSGENSEQGNGKLYANGNGENSYENGSINNGPINYENSYTNGNSGDISNNESGKSYTNENEGSSGYNAGGNLNENVTPNIGLINYENSYNNGYSGEINSNESGKSYTNENGDNYQYNYSKDNGDLYAGENLNENSSGNIGSVNYENSYNNGYSGEINSNEKERTYAYENGESSEYNYAQDNGKLYAYENNGNVNENNSGNIGLVNYANSYNNGYSGEINSNYESYYSGEKTEIGNSYGNGNEESTEYNYSKENALPYAYGNDENPNENSSTPYEKSYTNEYYGESNSYKSEKPIEGNSEEIEESSEESGESSEENGESSEESGEVYSGENTYNDENREKSEDNSIKETYQPYSNLSNAEEYNNGFEKPQPKIVKYDDSTPNAYYKNISANYDQPPEEESKNATYIPLESNKIYNALISKATNDDDRTVTDTVVNTLSEYFTQNVEIYKIGNTSQTAPETLNNDTSLYNNPKPKPAETYNSGYGSFMFPSPYNPGYSYYPNTPANPFINYAGSFSSSQIPDFLKYLPNKYALTQNYKPADYTKPLEIYNKQILETNDKTNSKLPENFGAQLPLNPVELLLRLASITNSFGSTVQYPILNYNKNSEQTSSSPIYPASTNNLENVDYNTKPPSVNPPPTSENYLPVPLFNPSSKPDLATNFNGFPLPPYNPAVQPFIYTPPMAPYYFPSMQQPYSFSTFNMYPQKHSPQDSSTSTLPTSDIAINTTE